MDSAIPRKAIFSIEKRSMPIMNMFADAIEVARTQSQIDLRPPGNISTEEKERGGRYAYWIRQGLDRKQTREYVGVEGSDAHTAAEDRLMELRRIQTKAKELRKQDFESVEHDAALVIGGMCNAGLFSGGAVLIGTRAFGAILNQLGYRATPRLGTQDVDIARLETIRLATPLPEGGFENILKQTGLNFAPVMGLERPPKEPTSFKVVGRDLKVDLLVPAKSSSRPYAVCSVHELGAHATTLPFLDYLIKDPIAAFVIGRDHIIPVRVPAPSRYCLHKLAVADLREGAENPKKDKDVQQAAILASILVEEDISSLEEAARNIPAAMAKHAAKSLRKLQTTLGLQYAHVFETIHRIILGASVRPKLESPSFGM